nr:Chain 1, Capsid protein VP2 [LuIII virus]6B9Q_2 Chain 2, Capsid protein VP2 [LuIII virus]6B9Q_3 Chain 3, Capsid protein VP2 [LuIII virus]6B9Q_4 Chain 4, Capsid protein VP2 [LuIII virus]6B9Q_5 Chain 5, Capsid protein VP2 [LuIII virus]6B9Q_6 Chain 6, Capsid protein VP2 [LuIII virus]6B9Q_7 Chain 7, Capsid protein VP2 [LuIII virus]6B9Q_8 Chain 8, Capsid protein VP2 [LuIII virus]6B9Q_A Chain A, Capsid protein VP2 [LuIII virus]6B9Q_B Chain B, Capsid protein VP2 [LuIII virus]6B9Q_C Chain C, C
MSDGTDQSDSGNAVQSAARVERAADGPGGSGGGGSGGGGVGVSTGSYDNQTHYKFLGDGWVEITAYSTRMVHLNMPKSENYCRVRVHNTNDTGTASHMAMDDAHEQIWTPWSLVDANAWGVWFQPSDWQYISNNMIHINLHSLDQELFNVVIKTVTEQNTGAEAIKVYNNDLTAAMMVALDSNNILPYTPAIDNQETLGFYPWKPTIPSPYRYYFSCDRNLSVTYKDEAGTITDTMGLASGLNSQFFTIENTQRINLLRTGDEYATGTYYFDTEPIRLTHTWQTNRHLGQPPQITELPSSDTANATLTARGYRSGLTQIQGRNDVTEATRVRPAQVGFCQPHDNFETSRAGPFKVPVVPADITQGLDHDANGSLRYTYDKQHGQSWASQNNKDRYTWDAVNYDSGRWTNNCFIQSVPFTSEPNANQILTNRDNLAGKTDIHFTNAFNSYGPLTAFPHPAPIYPQGQIWDKELDLEHKPRLHTQAPFVCKNNAPGQLLVRLAPNLTDQYDPNSSNLSRIVTYGTFFWKGKLTLKAKMRPNATWNPVFQISATNQGTNDYMSIERWLPTATGNITNVPLLSRPVARNTY